MYKLVPVGGLFIVDAMDASVEQAGAVLICVSERYQHSLKAKTGKLHTHNSILLTMQTVQGYRVLIISATFIVNSFTAILYYLIYFAQSWDCC